MTGERLDFRGREYEESNKKGGKGKKRGGWKGRGEKKVQGRRAK